MNNQTSRVTNIDGMETYEFQLDGFESLPATATRGTPVLSPEFTCFGHQWRLRVYPGGIGFDRDRTVGVGLDHLSDDRINIEFIFSVKGEAGVTATRRFTFEFSSVQEIHASCTTVRFGHSEVANSLVEGELVIEVRMKLIKPTTPSSSLPFIPTNPFSKLMLNKFMDKKSADVVFKVGGEQVNAPPVIFHAHRLILEDYAPMLARLSGSGQDLSPILITDVKPNVFHHMLYYAYGGKVAYEDLKANAKDILTAADKYEVVSLKLEAEAILVASTTITINNVMELILYANDKNSALLKEAVIDFIVENGVEVIEKLSFEHFPGHLVKDVLIAVNRGKGKDEAGGGNGFRTMRVSDLRKQLYEKGLNFDGSRETMIAMLKKN
mmetsp:Transcript_924/g.1601  ORF Transcript_924/g.1601 Transcript_924/m.1601 type:complete len:381 (+) Transcript_924:291-1433(+)|eukprot:CAMPEP_0201881398 /NCGR_PEP_ID=MMETSP0902-20130614/11714_1 /ASSEMBLY_ACC=CAM_ASM_000551 /TAXON_ID=420261 /ORGANISM="Thalassiosira antarctica, Strain CCMP982" /LENGTH=380 /DNA_ID=CAMNT_0048409603 /DNA_START=195 /DNA_END=1337 /DNA_ORIENTATION=-